MNAKFSLTSFSLTSFICWCERINKFSLTNFHCSQQYNYTVDEKKITTTRRQFRFFIIGLAYLTREKRLLARGRGCALLMRYEHSKRHMNRRWWVRPRATQRRSQSQGFASNSVQELREEDEGRFHNFFRSLQYDILNITTTRPLCARNFRIFFDKFSLSTRTDEQILQCDNFFLAKCTCSKAIMLAFEQVHLSRKKLTNSSLHTSK